MIIAYLYSITFTINPVENKPELVQCLFHNGRQIAASRQGLSPFERVIEYKMVTWFNMESEQREGGRSVAPPPSAFVRQRAASLASHGPVWGLRPPCPLAPALRYPEPTYGTRTIARCYGKAGNQRPLGAHPQYTEKAEAPSRRSLRQEYEDQAREERVEKGRCKPTPAPRLHAPYVRLPAGGLQDSCWHSQ